MKRRMAEIEDQGATDAEVEEPTVPVLRPAKVKALLEQFKKSSDALVRSNIKKFFKDREWHGGGRLSEKVLLSPAYVNMTLNLSISAGAEQAYVLLKNDDQIDSQEESEDGYEMPEDIKLVLGIQRECAQKRIPKCFAGGITLICLEQCHGISLPRHVLHRTF